MLVSALAAMLLLAAPEAVQPAKTPAPETKSTGAKAAPKKTCYTTTPSGSRMPRKVCVIQAPISDKGAEKASSESK